MIQLLLLGRFYMYRLKLILIDNFLRQLTKFEIVVSGILIGPLCSWFKLIYSTQITTCVCSQGVGEGLTSPPRDVVAQSAGPWCYSLILFK